MTQSKPTLLVENIKQCLTADSAMGGGPLGIISDGVIALGGETILWVGPRAKLRKDFRKIKSIDAGGRLVTPGLIDCHTHALFAGFRADEFFARLRGMTYADISQKGGGIARTAKDTAAASDSDLLDLLKRRLNRFLSFGVTTVEIKTGYGLSVESELRMLRLLKKSTHPVGIVPTFLGAHVVPAEFKEKRADFVRRVVDEMLPAVVREKLSGLCDVFCDEEAFSVEEARAILTAAKKLGLSVKIHADQFSSIGASALAAEMGAVSADHLENIPAAGIAGLARKGVIGVLIPGSTFFLGKRNFPPARKLLDGGVRVALSTDCNPGTSMTENLPLIMTIGAVELKMTSEEIWTAVTKNAARATGLTDRGELKIGRRADFVIWDEDDPRDVIYHYGAAKPSEVWIAGKKVPIR